MIYSSNDELMISNTELKRKTNAIDCEIKNVTASFIKCNTTIPTAYRSDIIAAMNDAKHDYEF